MSMINLAVYDLAKLDAAERQREGARRRLLRQARRGSKQG